MKIELSLSHNSIVVAGFQGRTRQRERVRLGMAGSEWGPLNFPLFESLLAGRDQSVGGGPWKMRTSLDELCQMFIIHWTLSICASRLRREGPINIDGS